MAFLLSIAIIFGGIGGKAPNQPSQPNQCQSSSDGMTVCPTGGDPGVGYGDRTKNP